MESKISSPFTEFYKVSTVFAVVFFIIFSGFIFKSQLGIAVSVIWFLQFCLCFYLVFDYWRMKEVEFADAGLIVTERFFFTQKSIFVPFEQIEAVNNRLWWLGNKNRVTVKFLEENEFGKEIVFIGKGFTRKNQSNVIEQLNRAAIRSKNPPALNRSATETDG